MSARSIRDASHGRGVQAALQARRHVPDHSQSWPSEVLFRRRLQRSLSRLVEQGNKEDLSTPEEISSSRYDALLVRSVS